MTYSLLWSDDDILIVDKPAGLLTIRDGYNPDLPYLSAILEKDFGRIWVVHRLDRETSGVMIFARNAVAHQALNTQFQQHQIKKIYHTIVIGMPEWEEISIALPLKIDGDRRHRTIVDHQSGKPAQTEAHVLKRLGLFSLVAAFPATGYTHQIRAHLSSLGFSILGDRLYKSLQPETQAMREAQKVAEQLPIHRLALHAYQMTFTHPVTAASMTVQAPYPVDIQKTIDVLTNFR